MRRPKRKLRFFILILFIVSAILFYYAFLLSKAGSAAPLEQFTVERNETLEKTLHSLETRGFIRYEWPVYVLIFGRGKNRIESGAYELSKSMSPWRIAQTLTQVPYMKWVIIPEGLRKEEISDILGDALGWDASKRERWISQDTNTSSEYSEGVYFPDTYLLPIHTEGREIARRLQVKFNEHFAQFSKEATEQNIKWTTAVKLASLIQREAAGKNDMPLISGILWNRLLKGMKLEVDATLQYARGKTDKGWWTPISPEDKMIDSPYNTYRYKGLPPHPIANPGEEAIRAVFFPEKTDCFYYLHDAAREIHCAKTYKEHLENIEKYLR